MVDGEAAEQRERVGSVRAQRERPPRTRLRIREPPEGSLDHGMRRVKRGMIRGDLESGAVGRIGLMQGIQRKQRVAEVQVRFRQPSIELDRPPAVLDRGAEVAEAMQHMTEVGVQPRIIRRPAEQVAIAACRRLVAPEPCQQGRKLIEGGDARVARQQPLVVGDRLRCATRGGQRTRELRHGGVKFGAQLNRPLQAVDPRFRFAGLEKRAAEIAVSLGESGFERNHAPVPRDGRRERAASTLRVGEIAKGRSEAWPKRERALAARDRGVRPSQPQQHFAQVVMRVGELGTQSGRAPEALGCPLEQATLLERLAQQIMHLSIARQRLFRAARRIGRQSCRSSACICGRCRRGTVRCV